MSYPWWKFRVTFDDSEVREYISTGLTVMDAIGELAHDDDFAGATGLSKEVMKVEFVGMADGYEVYLPPEVQQKIVKVEEIQHEEEEG